MVKVIRRFFDFCGATNRKKFVTSIWLGVLIALFEALKIPAIAVMMRALLPVELGGNGGITTNDILLSLGIMLLSILGSGLAKAKATMLQTEAGYDTCAMKRIEIAEHMRYLPMGYFNENSLGQITSVTTNVMESLENVATRVVMMVAQGLLTTLLIIAMLAVFDWRVALVLLVGLLWALSQMLMFPMMVTYELKLKDVIRNAVLLTVGQLPFAVLFKLITLAVPILALAVIRLAPGSTGYVLMAVGLLYAAFMLAFNKLVTASYANWLFETYLNPQIEGARTNIGLRPENWDDVTYIPEDDED